MKGLRPLYRTMKVADLILLRTALRLDARAPAATAETKRFCARRMRAIDDVLRAKARAL